MVSPRSRAIRFLTSISLAVYFIETGLVLTVAPWGDWWQRNYFASLWPAVGEAMMGWFPRAFVTAAGVVTTLAGLADLRAAFAARLPRRAPSGEAPPGSSPP